MKLSLLCAGTLLAGYCLGASIALPGGTQTVVATSTTGTSFTYTGTLMDTDTLALTATGSPSDPCLQSGPQYCTNAAGVLTTAGVGALVGQTTTFSGTINGTNGTWNYGSLLLEISAGSFHETVQLFDADAANGLGSIAPPSSLTLASTSLSALGFGSFSPLSNPTLTFILADTLYSDNNVNNNFVLTPVASGVPEPSSVFLIGSGLAGLAWFGRRARR